MNLSIRTNTATFCAMCLCLFVYGVYVYTWKCQRKLERTAIEPPEFIPDPSTLKKWRHYSQGLPSDTELERMTDKELHSAYHAYLDNTEILCHRKLRVGSVGDGGWEVCDDYQYRPVQPCLVYSFGINFEFSFDDEISVLYGCKVHSFDPSMGVGSHERSSNILFHDIALAGEGGQLEEIPSRLARRNGWRAHSFKDIRAMLKHEQTPIDIVKIDIEESEWIALEEMIRTGELSNVRQLFVEFHLRPGSNLPNVIRKRLSVLRQLQSIGFRRFYTHLNPDCDSLSIRESYPVRRTTCYETYFLNTKFVRSGNESE